MVVLWRSIDFCFFADRYVFLPITCNRYKGKGNKNNGKPGYVYKLGLRNGKANVDEYSPIYSPNEYKTDGDKYEGDLKLAAAAVLGVIGSGALAILLTSAL